MATSSQGSSQTDQLSQAKSDLDKMRDYFAAQPKETIRIPKDRGEQFVQVNGYSFAIAAGHPVSVPKQIAQMLRDAEVI
jgi:hypothetical protein